MYGLVPRGFAVTDNLFDFAEEQERTAVQPRQPKTYAWAWSDPWPERMSYRDGLLRQIKRDTRALDEESDEEMRAFFAKRIADFQEELKTL